MDFFFSFCDWKSFATIRRDQIKLSSIIFLGGIFFLAVEGFTFGEECDPSPVGGPLRIGVVTRAGELGQSSFTLSGVAIEPQILLEDALLPVGALGFDDNGMTVRRKLDGRVVDVVKEFVQCEFRFVGGVGGTAHQRGGTNSKHDS